jgi:hypothetical protein
VKAKNGRYEIDPLISIYFYFILFWLCKVQSSDVRNCSFELRPKVGHRGQASQASPGTRPGNHRTFVSADISIFIITQQSPSKFQTVDVSLNNIPPSAPHMHTVVFLQGRRDPPTISLHPCAIQQTPAIARFQATGLRESVASIRRVLANEATALGGQWDCILLAGISQCPATTVHTLLNLDLPLPAEGRQVPRRLGPPLGSRAECLSLGGRLPRRGACWVWRACRIMMRSFATRLCYLNTVSMIHLFWW